MTTSIPDFTDAELKLVNQTLLERYGQVTPVQAADAEIQLNAESDELTTCPVIFWEARGANFVVFKLGASLFKSQFFYNEATQYGTGKEAYDNLGDCVITTLQVQADHEQQMKGIRSGMTRLDIQEDGTGGYDGPLVI